MTAPMAPHHERVWEWAEGLGLGKAYSHFVEIWGRGGAKSTTIESLVGYVGATKRRRYALYVSAKQDQADKHVQAIATILERVGVERSLNVYGHSKGWKRNEVRCSNGFNVTALGLDVAVRGIKLDEVRPDVIILDDIDHHTDTPRAVEKKLEAISMAILPAGSHDCVVIFVQNLIHEGSIANKVLQGTADFLLDAQVRDPIPAVEGLEVERVTLGNGRKGYKIVAGRATWEGQNLEVCEKAINRVGLQAFLRESQHEVQSSAGLFFDESQLAVIRELDPTVKWRLCRGWDFAATEGAGDFTGGVLIAKADGQPTVIVDVKRHQFHPAKVKTLLRMTADQDRRGVVYDGYEIDMAGRVVSEGRPVHSFKGAVKIRLPQDPGAAGKILTAQQLAELSEFDVSAYPVTGAKSHRATPFAKEVNSGNVVLLEGEWNAAFRLELRLFRADEEHEFDDLVDAASDAFNELDEETDWLF